MKGQVDREINWNHDLNAWVVRRYQEVMDILKDPRFSAASGRATETVPTQPDPSAEKPHISRSIQYNLSWAKSRMKSLADTFCKNSGKELHFDLATDLLKPWSQSLALQLCGIGLEAEETQDLLLQAEAVFDLTDRTASESSEAMGNLAAYFLPLLNQRRQAPGADYLSLFAKSKQPPEVLLSPAIQLFTGLATSLPLFLGNYMLLLLNCREALPPQGGMSPEIQEELIRLAGPAQFVFRVATTTITMENHTFQTGDRLALFLSQANRDPEIFSNPEDLDFNRWSAPHLSFGKGIHACLGAPLVREASLLISDKILSHFPGLKPDLEGIRWGGSRAIRGVVSLPVFLS